MPPVPERRPAVIASDHPFPELTVRRPSTTLVGVGHTPQASWLSAICLNRHSRPNGLLVRVLQLEEVAALSARLFLLIDEVEAALVERLEPVVPAHLLQAVPGVAREVEPQHAEMTAVFRSRHSGRYRLARLRPLTDDFVVGGHQTATRTLRLVGRRTNLLRILQGIRRRLAGPLTAATGTL